MSRVAIHIISRTGRNHWLLESWLRRHGLRADWIVAPYSLSQGKNASVIEFLRGPEPFLLQLDDDIVPLPAETEPIFEGEGALVFCAYPPKKRVSGVLAKVMSGCMRIRRDILEAMEPPWFAPRLDPTGSIQLETEEWLVVEQAKRMGFEPVRVGWAGHLVEVVAAYREGRTAFAWPHEITGSGLKKGD